ncbi:MAG: mechanosensitive ion channel family protein [Rhodobacteraceae bacterium]|nr:mechanosensitive ion channel family protein [Paracoccaceae bacterium]
MTMMPLVRVIICLALGMVFSFFPLTQTGAQEATPDVLVGDPSPNDVRELMRLLSDTRMQKWLQERAEGASTAAPDQNGIEIREQLVTGLNRFRDRISALALAWERLPGAPEILRERWRKEMTAHQKVRSLTYVVIFLFVGGGMEWLYRHYTSNILLRVSLQTHNAPSRKALAALFRFVIISIGLLIFAVGSIGVFLTFDWLPVVESVVLNLLLMVFAIRAVTNVSIFFLAPNVPELRQVPLSHTVARHFHSTILWVVTALAMALALADIFQRLAREGSGQVSAAPEALSVTVLLAVLVFATFSRSIRRSFACVVKEQQGPITRRQKFWRLYLLLLMTIVFALWLIAASGLMWSILIIGLVVPLLQVLNAWANHFFDQARAAFLKTTEENSPSANLLEGEETAEGGEPVPDDGSEEAEDEPEIHDPYESYQPITLRLIRFVVLICAALLITASWGTNVWSMSSTPTVTGRVFSVLVDVTVAILIADLIWVWAKSVIDRRLADYKPPEDGAAPGPEARMATLLPLLRIMLMVTLLTVVILSVLSSLGVNIAPLLAGAGVLGIAIGFGAQSLVRDVVSGVFFLIDDAFRIGEYIEIGELRGTVEGMSIRSLRVRHHRGMVHTIPFGELKQITNHSRDWVIMKLEFRVPFETDLQLVKKLVKKVGAELKANEHYGPSILSTLKSQGVRRMEEFNMVVGVKFMTKPGEQWLVRRDAYQKTRDIFEANGIRLAERNVKVEIQGGEELDEEGKKAAAAAAQEVAAGPPKLPGAIPDEP